MSLLFPDVFSRKCELSISPTQLYDERLQRARFIVNRVLFPRWSLTLDWVKHVTSLSFTTLHCNALARYITSKFT